MASPGREFPLADVLTVTTGIVLVPVDRIYEILNWMTGDNLFTHQLGRALTECAPRLLEQHPDLADVDVPDFGDEATPESVQAWVDGLTDRYGTHRAVTPMAPDDHTRIDPITELSGMMREGRDDA